MNLSPEQLLDRYHIAMITADADAFAELYATDGVHEFPFFSPQGVTALRGPEEIRDFYRPLWANSAITVDRVETKAQHHTETDGMIIEELSSIGRRLSDGAPFELAGLVILTAQDGKIINCRDYMDLLGLQQQLS